MIFTNANNNFFAFVAKPSATDVDAIDGAVLDPSGLTDGDLVIVNAENEVLDHNTALSGSQQFKFCQRVDGKTFYSPLINFADCTITTGKSAATVQQVTSIGSDGTTARFLLPDATSDSLAQAEVGNSFYCLIEKQDNDEANRSGYAPAITAQVKLTNPNGLTDQQEINVRLAEQMREAIRKNDQLEAATPSTAGAKYLSAKVRVAGLDATDAATGQTATCTFGSNVVVFASAPNAEARTAGNYLLIGFDLYRIAETTSGASVTLDFPFAGTTGDYTSNATAGATTIGSFVVGDVQGSDCTGVGLELTGVAQHDFDVTRERTFSVSRFNTRFAKDGENVGAAITVDTAASEGLGAYQVVASQEYASYGALGLRWNSDTPAQVRPAVTISTANYGLISVREVTTKQNSLIGQTLGKTTYNIWFELEADNTTNGTANLIQETLRIQLGVSNANLIDRS